MQYIYHRFVKIGLVLHNLGEEGKLGDTENLPASINYAGFPVTTSVCIQKYL